MDYIYKLKRLNPWHFVWIIFLTAEVITLFLNILQSVIRWGYISWELIFIGIIDSGVNALIISPLAIYFLRHTLRLEETNKALEAEISERKQIEEALKNAIEEQKKLQEQLIQAQKLEAIGTLAGGVAHDFNNILSAIMTYTNLLLMKMPQESALRNYPENIMKSSERAAELVRSLLAFSRKQLLNPMPVEVNKIVINIGNLLKRLIGEHIELKILLSEKKLVVMADSLQIEQVLMNLSTNARDAIADTGTLTISIEAAELSAEIFSNSEYVEPGKYVLITVADTGEGMDVQTKERIFEPFFTTKEVGKGTGLGLATAYGIIRQHSGYITCLSAPGQGTEFRIYLPLVEDQPLMQAENIETDLKTGTETILVAEDSSDVRNAAKDILETAGYRVIEAGNGEEAVTAFLKYSSVENIDLLLFDIIMPKKNGREAYELISQFQPDIKVIFVSGYTDDIIHKKGILEKSFSFIEKPFTPQSLLDRIREVLDK